MPDPDPNQILQSIFDLEEKKALGNLKNTTKQFQNAHKKTQNAHKQTQNSHKKVYCVFNNGQPDIISDSESKSEFCRENSDLGVSLEEWEIDNLVEVDLERLEREVEALEGYRPVLKEKRRRLDRMIEDSLAVRDSKENRLRLKKLDYEPVKKRVEK